jgi:hypothetical protein
MGIAMLLTPAAEAIMFTIHYWNPHTLLWVDYIKTHESLASQTAIAEAMAIAKDPMEYIGSIVSYLADQVHWPVENSDQWKIVGPPGYEIPSYIRAKYEVNCPKETG